MRKIIEGKSLVEVARRTVAMAEISYPGEKIEILVPDGTKNNALRQEICFLGLPQRNFSLTSGDGNQFFLTVR